MNKHLYQMSRSRFAGYDARRGAARPTGGRPVTSTARSSQSVSLSVVIGGSTRVVSSHVKDEWRSMGHFDRQMAMLPIDTASYLL